MNVGTRLVGTPDYISTGSSTVAVAKLRARAAMICIEYASRRTGRECQQSSVQRKGKGAPWCRMPEVFSMYAAPPAATQRTTKKRQYKQ